MTALFDELGLAEVKRLRGEIGAIAKDAGFKGTTDEFIEHLRSDPQFFFESSEAVLAAYRAMPARVDPQLPRLFHSVPRMRYAVRAMTPTEAASSTAANYQVGSLALSTSSFFTINALGYASEAKWRVETLFLHEAVPGHHMQIATQQELDLPAWRKNTVFITAFVEGWGLYSERLGIDLGLYDTPQKEMGRLSYQMSRACRLVIDTGLHSKGWSKAQAVAYMKDNSALTDANIEAEINRYISNPGQALAYKIGQMKIEELRARAEKELGAKFDLRRFHDAVLGQGSVPMDALEAQIDAWIAAEKAKS